jgi:hypothetical protein
METPLLPDRTTPSFVDEGASPETSEPAPDAAPVAASPEIPAQPRIGPEVSTAKSARRDRIVEGLARGETHRAAAAAAGVSTKTVQRCASDPEVQRRIRAMQADLHAASMARMVHLSEMAVERVEQLLETGKEPVQLRAAIAVLKLSADHTRENTLTQTLADLDARIAAIDAALGAS